MAPKSKCARKSPPMLDAPPMSEYEKIRLANMEANAQLLGELNLDNLQEVIRKPKPRPKTVSPKVQNVDRRRSLRIRLREETESKGMPVSEQERKDIEKKLAEATKNMRHAKERNWPDQRPSGPLAASDYSIQSPTDCHEFLTEAARFSAKSGKSTWHKTNKKLEKQISGLQLSEYGRFKIATDRLYSVAFHPSLGEKLLIAAGDKRGHLGLATVDRKDPENVTLVQFSPHSQSVNCVLMPEFAPNKIFTCSYDRTIRCLDIEKEIFEDVYGPENDLCKFLDFQSPDVLMCALHNSEIAVLDLRANTSTEYDLSQMRNCLRTVSVNPGNRNQFAVAGTAGSVDVYDLRSLRPRQRTQNALYSLVESKSLNSAFFSPLTGNRMLTCSMADRITVYNLENLPKTDKLLSLVHNNHVGRWLTNFRPIFHPSDEDIIISGSMNQPRMLDLINVQSNSVTHLGGLTSVCSINAFHPKFPIVCGVNSSGYAHIWM